MRLPWFRSDGGKVRGTLMLKYRGAGLVKAGFIGVVLMVLVILVGLSPDRFMSLGDDGQVPGAVHRSRWPRGGQRGDRVGDQGRHGVGCFAAQRRRAGDLQR